ncbi:MAG TPA: hypothetical protein VHB21_18145, partial [Minicystis sp.]|nr:hypothetical protein [Minicystis sp.]
MMGWAPGSPSELPRFDISATGMRRVSPESHDAPEIEFEELDDEPTLIHDRPSDAGALRTGSVAPAPIPRTPLPAPAAVRRTPVPPPPRRIESDSSQFAVNAHAFAIAQHQARKESKPPPHVRPIFEAREAAAPAPPLVAPLPPPPPDLVSYE